MHEMSLTASIMDIIFDYARRHQFHKVNTIRLSFGTLSCIEPRALDFAFEVLAEGTLAEGAKLEYDIRPVVVTCLDCGCDSAVEEFPSLCKDCSSADVVLKEGMEELKIVDMDVD